MITTLWLRRKRLVDNLLDTLYKNNTITRGIKMTRSWRSTARLYHLPQIHEALVDSLLIDQLYLKLTIQHIKYKILYHQLVKMITRSKIF